MSIKNKKSLSKTNNAYRLKRIEEYLISQGYVQTCDSLEYRRWVDCIGNGRDICYNTPDISSDPPGVPGKDGYFRIDNPRKHEVFSDSFTAVDAVKRSRHIASWSL
jgi:hypothetical protein